MKRGAQRGFVLDASVALAWCFEDEQSPITDRAAAELEAGATVYASPLWRFEVANGLWAAERRGRTTATTVQQQLSLLETLPLLTDALAIGNCFGATIQLARDHQLTVYDASYLEIARRRGLALATIDQSLSRVAELLHVDLIS